MFAAVLKSPDKTIKPLCIIANINIPTIAASKGEKKNPHKWSKSNVFSIALYLWKEIIPNSALPSIAPRIVNPKYTTSAGKLSVASIDHTQKIEEKLLINPSKSNQPASIVYRNIYIGTMKIQLPISLLRLVALTSERSVFCEIIFNSGSELFVGDWLSKRISDEVVQLRLDGKKLKHQDIEGINSERQVSYYVNAAWCLGLLNKNKTVSSPGRVLCKKASMVAKYQYLAERMESSDFGWAWMKWAKVDRIS